MRAACLILLLCLPLAACRADGEAAAAPAPEELVYRLHYEVVLEPLRGTAQASVTLDQRRHLLREARFSLSGRRWTAFSGDGKIERRNDKLVWHPPETGGTLRWQVAPDHRRGEGYDARMESGWAMFRGEDAFPAAATRTLKGAVSRSTLSIDAPRGWSVVTPYRKEDGRYVIVNDERRFDRPTGWMVAGDLGVRRDTIAGVRVTVAGPVDQGVRRVDMLALLNWTLPEVVRLVPAFPDRLTLVSAGDPMWRGALSAPNSLYIHADRPLISENGTSTLLHELMHIALGRDTVRGDDWILEGLAEYYSIELLRRTGTVTPRRSRATLQDLAHSLKTPLAAMRSLLDGAGERDALGEQVGRMEEIVRYQLAKPLAGSGATLGAEPVPVEPELGKLADGLQKVYREREVRCDVDVEAGLRFYGDRGDLLELAGNLMENAWKWGESRVRVTATRAGDGASPRRGLVLSVEDDGPGIPDGGESALLERGRRLDESKPGQGIGLSVVVELAEAYRGGVEVGRSELGGARVTVRLPPG